MGANCCQNNQDKNKNVEDITTRVYEKEQVERAKAGVINRHKSTPGNEEKIIKIQATFKLLKFLRQFKNNNKDKEQKIIQYLQDHQLLTNSTNIETKNEDVKNEENKNDENNLYYDTEISVDLTKYLHPNVIKTQENLKNKTGVFSKDFLPNFIFERNNFNSITNVKINKLAYYF